MTIIKVKVWEALIANGTYVVHILLIKYGKVIVPVLISRLLFDLFNLGFVWIELIVTENLKLKTEN